MKCPLDVHGGQCEVAVAVAVSIVNGMNSLAAATLPVFATTADRTGATSLGELTVISGTTKAGVGISVLGCSKVAYRCTYVPECRSPWFLRKAPMSCACMYVR